MSKGLIEELRNHASARTGYTTALIGKAADALESQAREIAGLQKLLDRTHMRMDELKAQPSGVVAWLPIDTAPRDGSLVRLLVEFEDHATEDQDGPCPTIGANNHDNDGEDVWLFAGWDWSHDLFTQGIGHAIGWLPMLESLNQPASGGEPDCDRSACGDFSPGPCDNPDCPARRDRKPASGGDERAAFEDWAKKHNLSLSEDEIDQPEDINLDKQAGVYIWANAESAWLAWQARAALSAPSHGEQVRDLPPFAQKVISKLKRFEECADDGQGADIGRHWFDLLTQLGLLNRVQRSPGLWEITVQGEDVLAAAPSAGSQEQW